MRAFCYKVTIAVHFVDHSFVEMASAAVGAIIAPFDASHF